MATENGKGLFITFEGGEGSGKSTQARLLGSYFAQQGQTVTMTREPGGEALGRKLREILLSPHTRDLDSLAELFLYMADRAQHVASVIKPALARGEIVICDRYVDSTWAYQGYGRQHSLYTIETLNKIASHGVTPNLTILLDVPVDVGLSRANARNGQDGYKEGRFEAEAMAFHVRVRQGYLDLREKYNYLRFCYVNANADVETVHNEVLGALYARFAGVIESCE